MAEEIADLTGTRITDKPYENNVVFNTEGLSELLTNIKNYPVVNIDYVAENDIDESNNLPIWENYTNGQPCIKITYGNDNNQEGNLSTEDLNQIREYKQQLANLQQVLNIYNKYEAIESEYKTLVSNIQDELKEIIIKICNIYHKYLNSNGENVPIPETIESRFSNWAGSYYEALKSDDTLNNDDFVRHIYPGAKNNNGTLSLPNEALYYKISFNVNNILNQFEEVINNNNAINEIDFYTIGYSERNDDIINPGIEDNNSFDTNNYIIPFKSKSNNFDPTTISFWDETFTSANWIDNTNTLLDKAKSYNDLLKQTIEFLQNKDDTGIYHIKALLIQYAEYVRIARVNKYEEIRIYLKQHGIQNEALNEEVTVFSTDSNSPYVKMSNYVASEYLNANPITIQNNIDNIINDATNSKYELINSSDTYDSEISYYEKSVDTGNKYQLLNLNSNEFNVKKGTGTLFRLNNNTIPAIYGYKYVPVSQAISFYNNSGNILQPTNNNTNQNGTFRVKINNKNFDVPVKGLTDNNGNIIANKLIKASDGSDYNVGGTAKPVYFENGIPVTCSANVGTTVRPIYMENGQLKYCDYSLSTSVPSNAVFTDTKNTAGSTNTVSKIFLIGATSQADNPQTYSQSNCYLDATNTNNAGLHATRVFNAVFNDYAEYRPTISAQPGQCVVDNDDGTLKITDKRLMPGAQVISDTFGHAMGETKDCKTPLAVAGRVLVYTFKDRKNYRAGMAVCSAPGGTIDIMTREEIKEYPDCIVGIVSEIPDYETWGSDNVKVDGRIWIKVK